MDLGGPKEPCIRWGLGLPRGKGLFSGGAPLQCGFLSEFFDRLCFVAVLGGFSSSWSQQQQQSRWYLGEH